MRRRNSGDAFFGRNENRFAQSGAISDGDYCKTFSIFPQAIGKVTLPRLLAREYHQAMRPWPALRALPKTTLKNIDIIFIFTLSRVKTSAQRFLHAGFALPVLIGLGLDDAGPRNGTFRKLSRSLRVRESPGRDRSGSILGGRSGWSALLTLFGIILASRRRIMGVDNNKKRHPMSNTGKYGHEC